MKLLSIETSCDDTAISIFEVKGGATNATFQVLANASNSQIKVHAPYGGVFPMLAKREHIKNLPIVFEEVMKQAKLERKKKPAKKLIDAIAVTYGPGLEPSLWAGIVFAQELAKKWNVPLIPTNHMEGHIVSPFGKSKKGAKFKIPKIKTPILSLLVSGGHTQLVLSKKWMQYEIIGNSVDDAVGEAFDKVARMLGLPYPGGPQISKLAEEIRTKSGETLGFPLPRPMLYSKDFNFSFSGLKTSVLYLIQKIEKTGTLDDKIKSQIALEFENAAIDCLTYKTKKAVEKYGAKTVIVAGGVACNKHLQREMKKTLGKSLELLFPEKALTTDNSLMIGIAGYINFIKNKKKVPKPETIKATGNLRL